MTVLTRENFNKTIIENEKLVICLCDSSPASQIQLPTLKRIDQMYSKPFAVCTADINDYPEIAELFDVDKAPCTVFIENKKVKSKHSRILKENEILQYIK